MRTLLLTTTSLLLAAPALAQETDVITVTSSALETGADEITTSVEVVDQDHIEDNLSGSLADTIAHEPGVSTTYFGPAASRPVIRGLGADRVRVLTNGVGLIDASTSSPDHAVASEALEAERVEILRGPAAIAYGGGAIGGVVNVIDGRIPEAPAEDGFEGRFYAGATSVDDGETAAGQIRFNAGSFVFNLEMMTRTADDYDIPGFSESALARALEEEEHDDEGDHDEDEHEEEEEVFGTVENSGLDFSTGSVGVSWVGENGFIGVSYKSSDALYGIPGGHHHHEEEHEDEGDDHDDDDDHHEDEEHHDEEEVGVRIDLVQTRYDLRGEFRNVAEFIDRVRFSFGTAEYKHVELEGDEVGTLFRNDGWEGRFETRFSEFDFGGGSVETAAGFQAFSRDFLAQGEEAFVPASLTEDFGFFFVERWDTGDWGLEGGLRIENRDIETDTLSRDFDTFSISGSAFWRPQDNTFLAVTLSSNERAPTDVELFADGEHIATSTVETGDPDLDVEKAVSIEFTARTQFGSWAFEGAAFHAEYDGFIGAFPTGEEEDEFIVVEYRQEDASLSGFEGRLEGPLGEFAGWNLMGELTGEYVNASIDAGGDMPRIPPLSFTAGVTAEMGAHALHGEVVWAGEQDNVAEFELPTEGYTLLNARYSVVPFEDRGLRIILEGRNLSDEEARLHTSFLKDALPLPGRNFRAALVMDF
ncbi:MAG: TonB-dependent receptor [Maricaulis sp.]|jgi:iron complex outermembrane receptor protein|uniref:TonB-dependent receptor n=1 Tax=Maricaulis sp. TaxID=1486257 RepID=UPI001B151A17|nr:TonB-dependent receptor [Maricaulis sp.]MBO6848447.1 TonB-dependent receptor [Maricaulis sp.]MBO6878421.1 TonB-dependent receptor [Maricaulis sp.]MDM7983885.1 TonB-dependent receptor [Maricaulis sp.]